jgi:hypothetical protein
MRSNNSAIASSEKLINSVNEFPDLFHRPVVPLNDLVDYRGEPLSKTIPTWRKRELLPFLPKGSWAKISFAQLFWLRILDSLRQLGYPMEWMKHATDYFFKDAYYDDVPRRNLQRRVDDLKKKKSVYNGLTTNQESELSQIEDTLADEHLMYGLKWSINYLTDLIVNSMLEGKDAGILFFADGIVLEKKGSDYDSHRDPKPDPSQPHIYLSLTFFLKEFVSDDTLSDLIIPQVLNDKEKLVLKAIRDKKLTEVKIGLAEGHVKAITASSHRTVSKDEAEEIKTILAMKNYEHVTLKTTDGGSLFIKRDKKIR